MASLPIMEQGNFSQTSAPVPAGEQAKLLELGAHLAQSFSDALTVINGHAALLLERSGLSPEILQHASAIHQAGGQAARLAQQLLIIGGRHALHLQPVDLPALVRDMEPAIRHLLGMERRLDTRFSADPAVAWTDPALLEQALLGLAANARAAMPRGGSLTIAADLFPPAEADRKLPSEGGTGGFVCLTVRDTGCGMPPETLARVTGPCYIPDQAGNSAGFGLAAILGIAKASQGRLTIESQPQAGTTVRLYLPAAPADGIAANPVKGDPAGAHGKKTILLVDDEPSLRYLMALVLQSRGYRVLQAGSGAEALEAWKWHAPRIDLLFTDIVMPDDLSGLELAARFQAEKPDLKIIYLSGNPETAARMDVPPLPGSLFLQKPCSPDAVGQAVRTLLARKIS